MGRVGGGMEGGIRKRKEKNYKEGKAKKGMQGKEVVSEQKENF